MGIDVGKSFCWICVLNEDAECVYVEQVPTLCRKAWLEALDLFEGCELHAVFEVGSHYEWMYDLLMERCSEVIVVSPREKSHRKTDRLDAFRLANDLRRGELESIFVPPSWMRQDRRLVARIHALSSRIARTKNLMRELLYVAKLTCPAKDIAGKKAQKWIDHEALPQLGEQERLFFEQLRAELGLLQKHYDELMKLAEERLKRYDDAKIIRSIPGFGVLSSLAVLCAIGRIGRFQTAAQLPHYFGLCGKVDQSGDKFIQGSITKHGNKHVRWLVGQAVTHLLKRDSRARKRYLKLKRRKPSKVARVAVMRWLMTIVWWMLTNQEQYRLNGQVGKYLERKAA
jgi:transposase